MRIPFITQRPVPEEQLAAHVLPSSVRTKLQTTMVVLCCALAGVAMQLWAVSLPAIDTPAGTPQAEIDAAMDAQGPTVALSIFTGILCLILLPWAIEHDPREQDSEGSFPGKRRTLIVGLILCLLSFSTLGLPAAMVAFVSLASRRNMLWSFLATLTMLVSVVLGTITDVSVPRMIPEAEIMIVVALICIVCLLIAQARGLRRERLQRLIALARSNQQEFARRSEEARQEERLSIARDMHDSLSHRLSLIAIHSSVLQIRDDLDPETRKSEATLIRNEASAAVDDLRNVLSTLRTIEDRNPNDTVEQIIAAAQHAGDHVSLNIDESRAVLQLDQLPRILHHTLNRTLQEGLTNARKHAPGAPVTVNLVSRKHDIRLRISNPNGSFQHSDAYAEQLIQAGSGMGLVGLAERAQLVGGTLTTPDAPPTLGEPFTIELQIPRHATRPSESAHA